MGPARAHLASDSARSGCEGTRVDAATVARSSIEGVGHAVGTTRYGRMPAAADSVERFTHRDVHRMMERLRHDVTTIRQRLGSLPVVCVCSQVVLQSSGAFCPALQCSCAGNGAVACARRERDIESPALEVCRAHPSRGRG
jgi:hypothetical protein